MKRFLVLFAAAVLAVCGCASEKSGSMLARLSEVRIFKGDDSTAFRDPAVVYDNGTFHLFFSLVKIERDSVFSYTAQSSSRDLKTWSEPRIITPRDQSLNFSSPGNVVKDGDEWVLCLQTYPRPGYVTSQTPRYGDQSARIFTMRSRDLEHWNEPELLRVKGDDVPEEEMGRMIDPYLLQKDGRWWCFYKQNGVSMSVSDDLVHWTYMGSAESGENVCIIPDTDGSFAMFHSPANGVGVKRSDDLLHWTDRTKGEDSRGWSEDGTVLTFGQKDWLWARGRLTAGAVIDCRDIPEIGQYLMFFHASGPLTESGGDFDRNCSIGLAWSRDLSDWQWARETVPVNVSTLDPKIWRKPHPQDSFSKDIRYMILMNCRYLANTWWTQKKGFDSQAGQEYLSFGGTHEDDVRPIGHAAFNLTFALKSGIYDEDIVGVSAEDALAKAIRLISSMAHNHLSNCGPGGWGDAWQSAHWAQQGAAAAWFVWDLLDERTKLEVYNMTVHEADRQAGLEVPYYRSVSGEILCPGDTKAEENAWNSNITTQALLMFPDHPNAGKWAEKDYELQLSAYASPDDILLTREIDGRRPCDILKGSNMNEDGTVVNHGRIHPDYMCSFMLNGTNAFLYRLAGKKELKASTFNGDRVYRALTQLEFDGKTIYVRDSTGHASSQLYFPEGNDWGSGRQAPYWLMDIFADIYSWDKSMDIKAREWAEARVVTMKKMIDRDTTGQYFQALSESHFASREEFFGAQIVWGYMGWWLSR